MDAGESRQRLARSCHLNARACLPRKPPALFGAGRRACAVSSTPRRACVRRARGAFLLADPEIALVGGILEPVGRAVPAESVRFIMSIFCTSRAIAQIATAGGERLRLRVRCGFAGRDLHGRFPVRWKMASMIRRWAPGLLAQEGESAAPGLPCRVDGCSATRIRHC